MASGSKTKKILLVSTDRAFLQDTRTAFATSEIIELLTLEKSVNELRGEILEADFGTVIVDMDAAKLEEIESLQRVMRRLEGSVPVVFTTVPSARRTAPFSTVPERKFESPRNSAAKRVSGRS